MDYRHIHPSATSRIRPEKVAAMAPEALCHHFSRQSAFCIDPHQDVAILLMALRPQDRSILEPDRGDVWERLLTI